MKQAETIAEIRAKAVQEGKEQVIKEINKVLPLNAFSNQSVAYRVLVKDIRNVINENKKKQ
jgi:hypothetical protein